MTSRTAAHRIGRGFVLAGMAGPALFVAVFTTEGWLRPGYHPMSMFVSELSLGPRGWVQVANFVLTGVLLIVFGRGLASWLPSGPAARPDRSCCRSSGAACWPQARSSPTRR